MNAEQRDSGGSGDLDRRVRVHTALADPTRLRITDHLAYGDASPTELQALLGIPSNLLAHHLGVLEDADLVSRHRSEADRRRSYLHLVPDALGGLMPTDGLSVGRVVFVCTANSARSQLAAALWQQASPVPAASAGTHPADRIAPGAVSAARRHGLELAEVRPRQLTDVLAADDFVVTVCDNAHEELAARPTTRTAGPARHWSVPDPVPADTESAFDAAYDDLARRVVQLAPRLAPTTTAS